MIEKKLKVLSQYLKPLLTTTATVKAGSRTYDYITLEDLIDLVDEALIHLSLDDLFYQFTGRDGYYGVRWVDLSDGTEYYNLIPLEPSTNGQEVGMQLTYFSRYALLGSLGKIATKDDNLNSHSGSKFTGTVERKERRERSERSKRVASGAKRVAESVDDIPF
jgi:hypothetical protein